MAEYAVADKTIQKVLGILKAEGFLDGSKGRGVFVTTKQPAVVPSSHYPRP
jgi:DNA-binding GntR family transcriptional regulator